MKSSGPRRDGLDVGEGVEVHEFHVAGQCGVRSRARRGPVGGELPARRTVKFVEFALDRRGFGRQFVYCAAGVKGFPAQEFGITLFGSLGDDPFALFGRQGVFQPLRLAAPMSYMLTVAMAFRRGSIFAALMAKLPLPQIPTTPIRSRSTKGRVPRKPPLR